MFNKRFIPTIENVKAANLTDEAFAILSPLFKSNGTMRITKPSEDLCDGDTFYVWRMIAFYFGFTPALTCMPIGADDGLLKFSATHAARRERIAWLEKNVITPFIAACPANALRGVYTWGKALGFIGT